MAPGITIVNRMVIQMSWHHWSISVDACIGLNGSEQSRKYGRISAIVGRAQCYSAQLKVSAVLRPVSLWVLSDANQQHSVRVSATCHTTATLHYVTATLD